MKKLKCLFQRKLLTIPVTLFIYITGISLSVTLILLSSSGVFAQPRSFLSKGKPVNVKYFNAHINKFMEETGIPGASIAIIEDNKVIFSNFYGYRNTGTKTRVDSATLFEACSLSKIYLLDLVYKLVEEGRLDLNKPMYTYLENERLAHDPRYKRITPKMIINHTSGIENWQRLNNRDVLEILSNPGEKYVYSGEGYHYLAEVIATRLNEPYQSYISRLILTPETRSSTRLNYVVADSSNNISRGHDDMGKTLDKWITNEPWPASSVHTNAKPFSSLLLGMFNGQFLTDKSVKEMTADMKLISNDSTSQYSIGNGFFVLTSKHDTIFNFAGQNTGFRCDMFYSKVKKRGFVFFTNSDLGLLMGPIINDLTTKLELSLYFNNPGFKSDNYVSALLKIKNKAGIEAMTKEIDKRAEKGELYIDVLVDLMIQMYKIDKETGGKLALSVVKYKPESSIANAILGTVNLKIYHDYALAKSYLIKAKALNYGGIQIDEFIKECNDKLSANK
ncbi:CubicO group peptidase, beta-lactamase class C family [Pedobacter suwonensis]|uniref:CubicO group peptidase, beta-lactamase class C family n=1 Tax=Pedobacter suwonensis TaxID=332999 RepID=A0A1I0U5K0_9SPHI|nr:serine hydrolase domain-containing protein [Pedobacter suwonensis]SFA59308.1 CubicO group peptidase, beta-lactamase class C family [Pedobacter suwonensis]